MENDDSDSRSRFYSAVIQLLKEGESGVRMRLLLVAAECTNEETLELAYAIIASDRP